MPEPGAIFVCAGERANDPVVGKDINIFIRFPNSGGARNTEVGTFHIFSHDYVDRTGNYAIAMRELREVIDA